MNIRSYEVLTDTHVEIINETIESILYNMTEYMALHPVTGAVKMTGWDIVAYQMRSEYNPCGCRKTLCDEFIKMGWQYPLFKELTTLVVKRTDNNDESYVVTLRTDSKSVGGVGVVGCDGGVGSDGGNEPIGITLGQFVEALYRLRPGPKTYDEYCDLPCCSIQLSFPEEGLCEVHYACD